MILRKIEKQKTNKNRKQKLKIKTTYIKILVTNWNVQQC